MFSICQPTSVITELKNKTCTPHILPNKEICPLANIPNEIINPARNRIMPGNKNK
jgi:hypothetical protein